MLFMMLKKEMICQNNILTLWKNCCCDSGITIRTLSLCSTRMRIHAVIHLQKLLGGLGCRNLHRKHYYIMQWSWKMVCHAPFVYIRFMCSCITIHQSFHRLGNTGKELWDYFIVSWQLQFQTFGFISYSTNLGNFNFTFDWPWSSTEIISL